MLRYAMYVTVNIIFIHFDMHSFDMSYILTLVWPPKGLRNRLVARGRKRLCTTALPFLKHNKHLVNRVAVQVNAVYEILFQQRNDLLYKYLNTPKITVNIHPACITAVAHNVRPGGHIGPGTSPDVARDVQQENRLFQSRLP